MRAFTLIELLVVVSIIALLISILLPSLKRAREQAKTVMCLGNIRAIAGASQTYSNADRDEATVPLHPLVGTGNLDSTTYDWGGKSGIGDVQNQNPLTSIWGTSRGRGPASRPLNRYLYKGEFADYSRDQGVGGEHWLGDTRLDMGLLRCPSDRGYRGHHFVSWRNSRLSSYDHYGNSYAANTLWCNAHQGACVIKSWGPMFKPLSRIPNPANTIHYIENCGRFGWRAGKAAARPACWTDNDGPNFAQSDAIDVIRGWHGKDFQFVTSFVDGHGSILKLDGYLWPPPTTPRDPQGNAMIWECHVIRGKGWQMDVLPNMPVLMPVRCDLTNSSMHTIK